MVSGATLDLSKGKPGITDCACRGDGSRLLHSTHARKAKACLGDASRAVLRLSLMQGRTKVAIASGKPVA
jgi:hypothetical protein